ncbi:SMP-30/gluconolactonase/LRE family protein [Nocardia brasiliensis]|uniref:SMP-30/gluconolactonase/LRE family protein n=1 Tax=Nocardia brasiliensis TaxID=37326 RepID=UPI002454BABC|nr:SMP-30/gluconolactonase/LRE family protein [Nocardia brasiliensis]
MKNLARLTAQQGLLEAPLVKPDGSVLFSNVTAGGVFEYAAGETRTVVESRRGIGGLAFHVDGGLVMTGRDVSYAGPDGQGPLLAVEGATGFNDMTVGEDGSLYVGVLRHNPQRGEPAVPSEVVKIDPAGVVTPAVSGVRWPNGLGFAPDGTTLYVCEYAESRVLAVRDGDAQVFANAPVGECDGLAVDTDGGVWVALGSGGAVARFAPDGELDTTIDLPGEFVSSIAFDADTLYITTAGHLLTCTTDRTGAAVPRTRIPRAMRVT